MDDPNRDFCSLDNVVILTFAWATSDDRNEGIVVAGVRSYTVLFCVRATVKQTVSV